MPAQLVIISAPSGAGKNTIIDVLLSRIEKSARLVTTTSRKLRAHEQDGIDYYFLSRTEFIQKKDQGDFVEVNEYAGNFYGSDKKRLKELLGENDWVFAALDVNGKISFDTANIEHISIFVAPEALNVLETRIKNRGSIGTKELKKRIEIAKNEMEYASKYNAVVVNKDGELDSSIEQILIFLGLA